MDTQQPATLAESRKAPIVVGSGDLLGINERKTNMKYWIDKFDIYDRSPYNCIERVKTPLTKTLLLMGFVPWFLLWLFSVAAIGLIILAHDVIVWIFSSHDA